MDTVEITLIFWLSIFGLRPLPWQHMTGRYIPYFGLNSLKGPSQPPPFSMASKLLI